MAKTPVVMKIQDYKDREVQMVTYEFDQETDREGQRQDNHIATNLTHEPKICR